MDARRAAAASSSGCRAPRRSARARGLAPAALVRRPRSRPARRHRRAARTSVAEPNGGARVDVAFARPELGSPVLAFDLESGALLSVAHDAGRRRDDAHHLRGVVRAADHGVRWPRKSTEHPLVGSASTPEYAPVAHGLECVRFDAVAASRSREHGAACAAPPPDRFVLRWPAGDRPRRAPAAHLSRQRADRPREGRRSRGARVPRLGRGRHRRRCDARLLARSSARRWS